LQNRYDLVADDGNSASYRDSASESRKVTLWNTVDGTPIVLEDYVAEGHYLKKVLMRCTGCTFTAIDGDVSGDYISGGQGVVLAHIERVVAKAIEHEKAEAELLSTTRPDGTLAAACSVCGVLSTRGGKQHKHLEKIQEDAKQHEGAVAELVRLYTSTPPNVPEPSKEMTKAQVTERMEILMAELEKLKEVTAKW